MVIVGLRPDRGSSTKPSNRDSTNRDRHLPTVGIETPSCAATSLFVKPVAQARTIREHNARACADFLRRTQPFQLLGFIRCQLQQSFRPSCHDQILPYDNAIAAQNTSACPPNSPAIDWKALVKTSGTRSTTTSQRTRLVITPPGQRLPRGTGRRRRPSGRRRAALLPVLVVLLAVLAACGGLSGGQQTSSSKAAPSPPSPVTPTSTSSPVPTSSAPPNGTVFGDFREPSSGIDLTGAGGGDVHIIGSGHGFAVISASSDGARDTSVLVAFDVDGSPLGSVPKGQFEGSCGAEDLTLPDGRRLLLTELVTTTPAQGIIPATYTLTLQAWDARSGQSVWQSPLPIPATVKDVDCHADHDGTMELVAPTSDHAWAFVADGRDLVTGTVVDLATGANRRVDQVRGTLGPYLVGPSSDQVGSPVTAPILDPAGGGALGSIPAGTIKNFSVGQAYAPGGVTKFRQDVNESGTVLTSDGQGIVANESTSTGLVRYDLPSGTLRWRHAAANGGEWHEALADGGGVIVDGVGSSVAGLNDATGEQLWTLPVAQTDVCSVTNSQMAVIANSQLAIIDIKTGEQLSYGPSAYAGIATGSALCPDSLPGGLAVAQLQIAQIAQP